MATPTVRKVSYKNGIKRREQLILAASEIFGEFGYSGTSIRKIASEVGVSHAALARHFESKEDLLIEVLKHWDETTRHLENSDGDVFEFVEDLKRVIEFNVSHPGYLNLYLMVAAEASSSTHPAHEYISQRFKEKHKLLVRKLSEGVKQGLLPEMSRSDIEVSARTIISLMDGLELQWLHNPKFNLPKTFGIAIDKFMHELGASQKAG